MKGEQSFFFFTPSLQSAPDQPHLYMLGRLWLGGGGIDWGNFYSDEWRCRIPLPTYPFERQSYWVKAKNEEDDTGGERKRECGRCGSGRKRRISYKRSAARPPDRWTTGFTRPHGGVMTPSSYALVFLIGRVAGHLQR